MFAGHFGFNHFGTLVIPLFGNGTRSSVIADTAPVDQGQSPIIVS